MNTVLTLQHAKETMMPTDLMLALIAGGFMALMAAPLGCFVVWRKMAYFGDSLAHSALLGIALGMIIGISQNIAIAFTSSVFALLLAWLVNKRLLSVDTLLGILAHAALAIGIVAIGLLERGYDDGHGGHMHHEGHMDIHSFLLGDINLISMNDVLMLGGAAIVILALMYYYWQAMVLSTIDQDLAFTEGVKPFYLQVILMCCMALVVALSMHLVGILLITAMLIIPAAAARIWAKNPEKMVGLTTLIGLSAMFVGITLAYMLELKAAPVVVLVAFSLFILVLLPKCLNRFDNV